MKSFKTILAAAFTVFASSAIAAPITSNPTFTNDGLSFDSFTCHITKGGIFATPSKCSQIDVSADTSPAKGLNITSSFVAAPLSFDSRYFGPVPLSTLTVVKPLWTFSR